MLAFYSERLPTVEINNSFYQMPKVTVLENWARSTPAHFRFAIKATAKDHARGAHQGGRCGDSVAFLYKKSRGPRGQRGPVLFQLPPFLKKDLPRLTEFLQTLPAGHAAAFEFRNDSGLPMTCTTR